jgi:uncharacterized protein
VRLLILAFLAYVLYRLLKGVFASGQKIKRDESGGAIDEMVKDPSCQTYIPLRDSIRRVIGGGEYFFCSKECADKFEKEKRERS